MAKKFLVLLVIAILFIGIAKIPAVTAGIDPKQPDITTEKIIILDPTIMPFLRGGTLSIISFIKGNIIGFQVGYAYSTNLIVILDKIIDLPITQPVALLLKGKNLEIYISNINIVTLDWLYLSAEEIPKSYFPLLINAQIVRLQKTGYEKEINCCCNPPKITVKWFYKMYLNTEIDPYTPATTFNIEIGVMVPTELESLLEQKARDHDYIFIGISAPNAQIETPYANTQIYLWLSP